MASTSRAVRTAAYAGSVEKGFGVGDLRELAARLRPLIIRKAPVAVRKLSSDAQHRPPTAAADTRCSGEERLQGAALDRQPLLTGKLLIQIGSRNPAPVAFDVHDVIPKLNSLPPIWRRFHPALSAPRQAPTIRLS